MERCKVSGAEITSSPDWVFRNPAKHYATRIKRIDKNILFAWVDSTEPVTLEIFEGDLVRRALEESDLEDKPVYFIWNLDRVKEISYAYKRGIADFLYNPSPPLKCVVFYNILDDFLNTAESIQAILPSSITILFAENYTRAISMIFDLIAGKDISPALDESDEEEELKKKFLASAARIGWMNMLTQPVALPDQHHVLYPFFNALTFLQQDLLEREALHREKKKALKKIQEEKTKKVEAQLSSLESRKKMLLKQSEDEKTALEKQLSFKRNESRTIGTKIKSSAPELRKIIHDTTSFPIHTQQKKQILDICDDLLDIERNQGKTGITLTSTDSALLSLLQKKYPNLNNRELTICLLIKLNYDNTEIADYYGITKRGTESIRYRMHKKIGLKKNQSLKNHLTSLAETLGPPT